MVPGKAGHLVFGGMQMRGSEAAAGPEEWKPSAAWVGLAFVCLIYALGSNLFELVLAYVLHDPRAMLVPHLADRLFDDVARWLMLLVGLAIAWRARARHSAFFLGLALVCLASYPLAYLGLDEGSERALMRLFNWFLGPMVYLLPAFAIQMLRESNMRVPAAFVWTLRIGALYAVANWLTGVLLDFTGLAPIGLQWLSLPFATLLPYLLAIAIFLYGWVAAPPLVGQRMMLLLLAVGVIIAGNILFAIFEQHTGEFPRAVTNFSSLCRVIGSLLFAYAILRHRVIDLGFAVNRTLVYGAAAFTLLAVFGLVEYLAKGMIPKAWPDAGHFITAGLAVLLFLSFHHLHHWFEHHIERLFFKDWQDAEKALKRFVQSASHFETTASLCRSSVTALSDFARGSSAALYLRGSDASYRLEAGGIEGAPAGFSADNPAFALMRAERQPLDLAQASGHLPGALALPMIEQGALVGFVLLGCLEDGTHYRPDQIQLLDWAVNHIGLDLRALHARQLEGRIEQLGSEVLALTSERDSLRAIVSASVSARPAP